MGFLDKPTDMSRTAFKAVNVPNVKAFLASAFDHCRPGWAANPAGEVGRIWKGESESEHQELVVLGLILDRLQHSITARSQPILRSKVNELLGSSGNQYREVRAELQFAADLSLKHLPISMAPFVPAELLGNGRESTSPDYGIRTADGDIAFEVTSFYLESFERWDRVTSLLADRLLACLKRRKTARSVVLGLPSRIRVPDVNAAQLNQLADRIAGTERGQAPLHHTVGGIAKWEPLPHLLPAGIDSPEQAAMAVAALPEGAMAATLGNGLTGGLWLAKPMQGTDAQAHIVVSETLPTAALCIVREPIWEDAEETIYKSLKNTLKAKRDQYPEDDQPYILVVRIGHGFIREEMFFGPLNRFWCSRTSDRYTYGWVSAVVFYEPATPSVPKFRATVVLNPNARHLVPQSFIDLLSRPTSGPMIYPP
jgi:hypothetical protein